MGKNRELAKNVLTLIGGKDNINNAYHCMTRLRFKLKDARVVKLDEFRAVEGVLGVNVQSGELQVVIGQTVDDVYNELIELAKLDREEKIEENLDTEIGQRIKFLHSKDIFNMIIGVFSGCMSPLVPTFVLIGMLNCIAVIIGPVILKLVPAEADIYTNFYYVSQAIIYFLPVLIAVTAAKHFKVNLYISLVLAFVLVYPEMITAIGIEGGYTFYGMGVPNVAYASSVIPMILIVWIQQYVERFVKKIAPEMLKVILFPLLTVLIMVPLSLCLLGPVGYWIGTGIANFIGSFYQVAGPIATMLVCAFIPFITAFGIGKPIFFTCMTALFASGVEYTYMPFAMAIQNYLIMGIALGYTIKSKKAEERQLGTTCFISSMVGGVTEPTLFGILLPNKSVYLPVIVSGAVAGLAMGIMKVGYHQFGPSNVLAVLGFMGENDNNFRNGCICAVVAFVISFLLMMLLYKPEEKPNKS